MAREGPLNKIKSHRVFCPVADCIDSLNREIRIPPPLGEGENTGGVISIVVIFWRSGR